VSLDSQLRIGSLEILAALSLFGVIAARMRPAEKGPSPALDVHLRVRESAAGGGAARDLTVGLDAESPARLIGRSRDADIALADPEVSRRHARFELVHGVVYLSDLGSSNGTFLNGKPVEHEGIEVRPGDDIDVGNTRISVIGTGPASWT
jgi:hypothetical protein